MKKIFLKFGIIAAALGMAATPGENSLNDVPTRRRRKQSNRVSFNQEKNQREINLSRGLKEFFYKGGSVWAINQKNADRKAEKLGLGDATY